MRDIGREAGIQRTNHQPLLTGDGAFVNEVLLENRVKKHEH